MADTHDSPSGKSGQILRILSYNVHSCIGTDRQLNCGRIADVIADIAPDIIGLQELDVGRQRTGGADQAHIVASLLSMDFHFHAALHVAEERYGDAILTALPMKSVKAGMLPSSGEQRGALWTEISVGGQEIQVFNTHLGLRNRDRVTQMTTLLGPSWIGSSSCTGKPCILLGDLNSVGRSAAYRLVTRCLKDVQLQDGRQTRPTFPSRYPFMRLDHIFVSAGIEVLDVEVISTPLARRASDHLPLVATIAI